MLSAIPHADLSIRRLPWVTWSLAAAWTAAALATTLGLDVESAHLGMDPGALTLRGFAAHWLFSATAVQWLVSCLIVLAIGPHLEEAWGPRFFAGFFATTLASTAGLYAFLGPSGRPLVGAGGALAALTAALIARFGISNLRTYVVAGRGGPSGLSFEVPAYAALGLWFAGEVLMTAASPGTGPTRGLGTTLPFFGLLLGGGGTLALRQFDLEERLVRPEQERSHPALTAAQEARDAGRPSAAVSLLEPAVRQRPGDAELVRALCDAACAASEPARAAGPLQRLIVEQVRQGEAAVAAGFWRSFGTSVPGVRLDPRTAVELAVALSAAGDRALAGRVLRDAMAGSPRLSPGVALRIAEVAAPLHRETAIRAAKIALAAQGLDEAKRAKLEARVAALESKPPAPEPRLDDEDTRGDRTIDVELDPLYAPVRPPELPPAEPPAEAFQLSADGSLEAGGAHVDLAERNPDTEPTLLEQEEAEERAARAAPTASAPAARPSASAEPAGDAALDALGAEIAAGQTRFHELKCIEGVPIAIDGTSLSLRGGPRLAFAQIDGIAVAAVHGLSERPVILVDLLLNWTEITEAPLRSVRLRSDRFDPRALFPDAGGPLDAFRALLDALHEGAGATSLPDAESARGRPFRMFPDLARYEREVLQVER